MNPQERALIGQYLYWPDTQAVTLGRPLVFTAQRVEILGTETWLHGRAMGAEQQGSEDIVLGDPGFTGYTYLERALLVASPTAGCATALA